MGSEMELYIFFVMNNTHPQHVHGGSVMSKRDMELVQEFPAIRQIASKHPATIASFGKYRAVNIWILHHPRDKIGRIPAVVGYLPIPPITDKAHRITDLFRDKPGKRKYIHCHFHLP